MSTTLFGSISNDIGDLLPLITVGERAADPEEATRRNNDNLSANIRVGCPAQVVSWDPTTQTIVAQPLIRENMVNNANGDLQWVQIAPIPDVPVSFPQGGLGVLTFPIAVGDECWLTFGDSSFDSWWQNSGVQNWTDKRRHDLSDAIAWFGVNSLPNVITDISSTATELRTKDGTVKVSIAADNLTLTFGSNTVVLDSAGIHLNGTLNINGFPYLIHTHGGVTTGPGVTTGVIP